MKLKKMFMRHYLRLLIILCAFAFGSASAFGQVNKWRDLYKVKKKDTIYGIAKQYNLSVEELLEANPEMRQDGYTLKKGEFVFIPFNVENTKKPTTENVVKTSVKDIDIRQRAIRVGVMLPLHDADGDGRRMVEYYRGLLIACDSLKRIGISTDVHSWNVPADGNISLVLLDADAAKCDIIFGPLYTDQVKTLGNFCLAHGIKLVIPFSISSNDVTTNTTIYQIYQAPEILNQDAVTSFMSRFSGYHPVFIDCNDTTSKKGDFTFSLRKQLDAKGIKYNITNLKSSEPYFAKAFSRTQPNVVILNTGRSPELNVTFAKLDGLTATYPGIKLSMFGYTEWLMYTKVYLDYYFKYDTYIPSTFYYNSLSTSTMLFENAYRRWFHADMLNALPRFAMIGYDQAQFFLSGLHDYGKAFSGIKGQSHYVSLQTPLVFKKIGNGGMQNASFMLVHYVPNHGIESISY
jgi:murein DD-endopeptidase MepM/ murein hydrolase activator NlpD